MNPERYHAVDYMPTLYTMNQISMVSMIHHQEKDLFELSKTFDQYIWLVMFLALMICGLTSWLKFIIEMTIIKKKLNKIELILVAFKLTVSLLETLLTKLCKF